MQQLKMVSLIPARGGSERIPRKNIKMMAGKPMLAWSIEASLKSKYINRTFVSTEDKEIKDIALSYKAEVVDRPKKYSTDDKGYELTGIIQQLREYLIDNNCLVEYLCFLYPSCPLRTAEQIDGTFELMKEKNAYVGQTAIIWQPQLVEEYFEMDCYGKLYRPVGLSFEQRSLLIKGQNIHPDRYIPTDNAFIMPLRSFMVYHDCDYRNMIFYIIPKESWIDINEEKDFEMAEMILKKRMENL